MLQVEGEDGEVASNLTGIELARSELRAKKDNKEALKAFYQLNEAQWAVEFGNASHKLGELYEELVNA